MSFFTYIQELAQERNSWVCVGLDVDPEKIPAHLRFHENGIVEFAHEIIRATQDRVLCYKINSAFYEALGVWGQSALEEITESIPEPVPFILDAKRADIANSSEQYARACFETLAADAVTVNPYLGRDALEPFLEYENRGVIVLGVTTNPGAQDFQYLECNGAPLYEHVARKVVEWNERGNCGLVVGATQGGAFRRMREIAPEVPFLVPGVGAQGGALDEVVRWGVTQSGIPPIINSSRGILYASGGEDFAEAARSATIQLQEAIQKVAGGQ